MSELARRLLRHSQLVSEAGDSCEYSGRGMPVVGSLYYATISENMAGDIREGVIVKYKVQSYAESKSPEDPVICRTHLQSHSKTS